MVLGKKNGKEGMNMRLGGVKIEQSKTKKLFGIYIWIQKPFTKKDKSSREYYTNAKIATIQERYFTPLNILQDCQVFLQSFWQAQDGEEELCYSTKGTTYYQGI